MSKKRFTIWAVIFASVLILGFSYYNDVWREAEAGEPATYSVILYRHAPEEWVNLMEGIDQAEEDFGVKVRYTILEDSWGASEQAEIIERELNAGVSGILLAAADSGKIGDFLDEINVQVPVITVETGVESGKSLAHISGDNYEMGCLLGKKILADMDADGGDRQVTIIREYMERDSVQQRYDGLVDTLEAADKKVTIKTAERRAGDFSLELFLETMLPEISSYIAALDKFCTEEAAKAWENSRAIYEGSGEEFYVYGIGNTAQTVNDLDSGRLRALVFQNEFNMGYQGIQAFSEKDKKGYIKSDITIRNRLVTRDNMYDEENERLLFPSI